MSSDNSKHLFNNKEYMYVRRLISVLTNDDSDKLIVEKLKGKNLSSLLYNAKVIDNSKNMAANKRILGCVIRAIEKEKHLCRRRELDQSWGRKLLSSFNCLNPIKPIDELSERSINKSCTVHSKKTIRKNHKHQELEKRRQNQSVRSVSKTVGQKRSGFCSSTVSERKNIRIDNSAENDVEVPQEQSISSRCAFLVQKKVYETVCPPNLGVHQPKYVKYVYVDPIKKSNHTKPVPTHVIDKKTSSTQTFKLEDPPEKEQTANPSNIKLQDLLEAATSLINTRDQKEYVKSFLSNFEPPFDLTSGFPPYLKLPMRHIEDIISKESVYGSNSEMSVVSGRMSPRQVFESSGAELSRQKEDHVKKFVRELNDPWQEAAESIISGVINETLPHDKADYSQLGACILKRLGAYPSGGLKDQRISRMNTTIPEIVLSCTEWFESGTGDLEKKPEQTKENNDRTKPGHKTTAQHKPITPTKKSSSESIQEIKLLEDESDYSKVSWERQRLQNYCFYDGSKSKAKVGLLDVSEGSIGDFGINSWEEVHEVTRDGDHLSQDRNHFPRLEPLTISPSVLDQANRKDKAHKKNGGDTVRWCDSHVNRTQKSVQDKKSNCKEKITCKINREVVPNVASKPLQAVDSSPDNNPTVVEENVSATVANLSAFLSEPQEAPKEEQVVITYVSVPENEEPPTPEAALWEPTAAKVETFDGLGECHSKVTDVPKINKSPSDKKLCTAKTRARSSFQDKFRGKKKCKNQGKPTKAGKDEVDITRNCKVM